MYVIKTLLYSVQTKCFLRWWKVIRICYTWKGDFVFACMPMSLWIKKITFKLYIYIYSWSCICICTCIDIYIYIGNFKNGF